MRALIGVLIKGLYEMHGATMKIKSMKMICVFLQFTCVDVPSTNGYRFGCNYAYQA